MLNCYRRQLISSLVICLASFDGAFAVSKRFKLEADALKVILVDSTPCFYIPSLNTSNWEDYLSLRKFSFTIYTLGGKWEEQISNFQGIPKTKETCLKYGVKRYNFNVPIYANLDEIVGTEFCIHRRQDQSLLLVEYNESKQQCTTTPLNEEDKPSSFWKRLFSW